MARRGGKPTCRLRSRLSSLPWRRGLIWLSGRQPRRGSRPAGGAGEHVDGPPRTAEMVQADRQQGAERSAAPEPTPARAQTPARRRLRPSHAAASPRRSTGLSTLGPGQAARARQEEQKPPAAKRRTPRDLRFCNDLASSVTDPARPARARPGGHAGPARRNRPQSRRGRHRRLLRGERAMLQASSSGLETNCEVRARTRSPCASACGLTTRAAERRRAIAAGGDDDAVLARRDPRRSAAARGAQYEGARRPLRGVKDIMFTFTPSRMLTLRCWPRTFVLSSAAFPQVGDPPAMSFSGLSAAAAAAMMIGDLNASPPAPQVEVDINRRRPAVPIAIRLSAGREHGAGRLACIAANPSARPVPAARPRLHPAGPQRRPRDSNPGSSRSPGPC